MTRPEERGGPEGPFEGELRDVLARSDPVPEDVKARARAAADTGRGPEGSDLLDLLYDSVLDTTIDLGCEVSVRLLTFAGAVRVELRVSDASDGGLVVEGWVAPIVPREVRLRTEELTVPVGVDADGVFRATCDLRTRVSFVLEIDIDGRPRRFHTGWFMT